ncbi:hypothetical protein Lfu02_76670 [Longispora fulva]|uniref:Uncharacterized protein n=1 Tax=Longispora fulva TaxID=619741 RepID=A0A8J7GUM4_9ACTN|nr:hypothetical protein [Longispora fulva]MBG6138448.1 hypothetical protein [Longispora fulva]GIG63295.1 hypothetical protein Lfu02_76670 [Longispora fulva]
MAEGRSFASASVPRHLARGAVGFGALIGSVTLLPGYGPVSLLLAPVGLLALRGCPTCWAIGLIQTLSRGRLRRSCTDGRCELTRADHAGSDPGADVTPPGSGRRAPAQERGVTI